MNFKTIEAVMLDNKSIKKYGNLVYIDLSCGSVEMDEKCLKIMIHYDFDFIMEAIENEMREMICTEILKGIIYLPCGFLMSNFTFTIGNKGIHAWISVKPHYISEFSSISGTNLLYIDFKTYDVHTHDQIKEVAKKLFDTKMKLTGEHSDIGNFAFSNDEEIDWERCFDESTPDELYKLFSGMQKNFMWSDIENIIYVHSLFGQAYINAVKRVTEYENSQISVIKIPESYIVYDEFRKILKKLYFNGFKIRFDLFVCYVKDYILS